MWPATQAMNSAVMRKSCHMFFQRIWMNDCIAKVSFEQGVGVLPELFLWGLAVARYCPPAKPLLMFRSKNLLFLLVNDNFRFPP
jgi:hypothetical protein